MIDMKMASLASLEYERTNVGILVGCYHGTIELRGSIKNSCYFNEFIYKYL